MKTNLSFGKLIKELKLLYWVIRMKRLNTPRKVVGGLIQEVMQNCLSPALPSRHIQIYFDIRARLAFNSILFWVLEIYFAVSIRFLACFTLAKAVKSPARVPIGLNRLLAIRNKLKLHFRHVRLPSSSVW